MPWKGNDEYTGAWANPYRGANRPMWSPDQEAKFLDWWKSIQGKTAWSSMPDEPSHAYDYRGAFIRGITPGPDMHWPSELKYPEHPRRFINGYDTPTGNLAPWAVKNIWEE